MPIAPLFDVKFLARTKAKNNRKIFSEKFPAAAAHAARQFMDHIPYTKNMVIGLYHPVQTELDTGPLATALREEGVRLALPVITGKKSPLIFRLWEEETLVEGAHKIKIPPDSAPQHVPDIILTPLLSYREDGARLGYGGGYYDRTFAAPPFRDCLKIGFAYADQLDPSLPTEPHDQKLDFLVTERKSWRCEK